MRIKGFLLCFFLFMVIIQSSLALQYINIDRIRHEDVVYRGDILQIAVRITNEGDAKLKNTRITAAIAELDIRKGATAFDLGKEDEITKKIDIEIPSYAAPGLYFIKITVSNVEVRRVRYRPVIIV